MGGAKIRRMKVYAVTLWTTVQQQRTVY